MTPLKLGNTDIGAVYLGSTPINKIYVGTNLIFEIGGVYYELIEDIEVTGSAVTSVQFSGLNITKEDDVLLVSDINNTGANSSYSITINNNNTRTNYWRQTLLANGSATPSGSRANVPDYSYSDGGFKTSVTTEIKLTNDGYFTSQTSNTLEYNSTSLRLFDVSLSSTFTVSSITQIDITSVTLNTIGIGSRFQLYRRL